ncbi:MAG: hypothetical protein QW098_01455 [Candidatus Hadarchaeales archaeon]
MVSGFFDDRSEYHIHGKGVYGPLERWALERRKKVRVGGIQVYIASAEDTLAHKLRVGGEQDLKDAEGIFIRQRGRLDMRYLERVCREMGVWRELAKLKRRVGRG